MFIEKNDHTKMSFRSVGEVNVANLAEDYFNGGGHKNAAGGIQLGSDLETVVEKFKSVLPEYKDTLNQYKTLKATI
jgi:phosphoesterase RecJ-like protein